MATHAGHLPKAPAREKAAKSVDPTARRAARRVFRPRRVWPALVVAGVLTVAGALVAIEVISTLVDQPAHVIAYDRPVTWTTETAWKDTVTIVLAAVLLAAGLCCLLAGLKPGHTGLVPLRSDDPELVLGVTAHGLRRAVETAASDVELVSGVRKVKLRRRRVAVTVDTAMRTADGLDERVRTAVQERLDELAPEPRRGVVVRVRHTEG